MSVKVVRANKGPGPEEFRIAASDTKGHSARMWFRCIPAMARMVEQVIASKKFPYRTKGDILRHALHRHMYWLNEQGDVPSVGGQVDAVLEILRDEEFDADFAAVIDKLGVRVASHISNGAGGEARRLLLRVNKLIEGMPAGFWRDKYKKELMNNHGHLLKEAPKAKFSESVDD